MSASTTLTQDQQNLLLAEAEVQIKAGSLSWEVGLGFGFDYKAIKQNTGITYGPAWRFLTTHYMPEEERIPTTMLDGSPMPDVVLAARIAEARAFAGGQSWGYLAARCGLGAGRVQRLFRDATGLSAQGLRIGRGGRFLNNDAELYTGEKRAAKGSEVVPGMPAAPTPEKARVLPRKAKAAVKRAEKVLAASAE